MFIYLCILVCLATMALTTITATIAIEMFGRLVSRVALRFRFPCSPTLLFNIYTFPFMMSLVLTAAFVLPAFLVFEPRSTTETPEPFLIALAFVGGCLIAAVLLRSTKSILSTRKLARQWLRSGRSLALGAEVAVYAVDYPESLVAIAGILAPRVFIGEKALKALGDGELRAAIEHEIAHVRSLDNLKHLVVGAIRPPRFFKQFAALESSWRGSVEAAADRRALESGVSPYELGGALIKIGRISPKPGQLSSSISYLLSGGQASGLDARIGHLEKILSEGGSSSSATSAGYLRILLAALVVSYVSLLPLWLTITHQAIEWLVQ